MNHPILVTGLPRSGTSWAGRMLTAGGELVYVNEPLNPQHPPGGCPGVLAATVTHRFQYICGDNEAGWLPAFRDTVALRYHFAAEAAAVLRQRSAYDLARMVRYGTAFTAGRLLGRRALLDDPFAVFSAGWFAERLGCQVIVMLRDPVSFAASWRRLGWSVDVGELLTQPLLLRDHPELGAIIDHTPDPLATTAALWRVAAGVTTRLAANHPGIVIARYEDLAADPLGGFRRLYTWAGLRWSRRAESRVRRACMARTTAPATAFAWTGLSRTAFRRMDSRAAPARPPGLSAEEISRVRAICELR